MKGSVGHPLGIKPSTRPTAPRNNTRNTTDLDYLGIRNNKIRCECSKTGRNMGKRSGWVIYLEGDNGGETEVSWVMREEQEGDDERREALKGAGGL